MTEAGTLQMDMFGPAAVLQPGAEVHPEHDRIRPAEHVVKKDLWQMTREEFFNDPELVNRHVNKGGGGFKVSYEYISPGPAGPFKGSMTMDRKPAKGNQIPAMFGLARVIAVSTNTKPEKLDNLQLYERGKVAHRKGVEEALAAGLKVPADVLADYPDLAATV